MSFPEYKDVTLEEFYQLREESDQLMEYVDGVIFMFASPSTKHQRISGRLHAQLFHLLEGSDCEVFHAPYDIDLKNDEMEGDKIVVPDLSVICDKSGLTENKYTGVPTVIFEIVSPSNQAHDLVFKLNLYMQYGVKEYWIVNPILNTVQLFVLDESGEYRQEEIAVETGKVKSTVLSNFAVDVEKLFA